MGTTFRLFVFLRRTLAIHPVAKISDSRFDIFYF
jgi:hypothetical protein